MSEAQGGKAVVVVIMEFCDMGTLLRAITKQAFKPHGKWKLHTTYVSSPHPHCSHHHRQPRTIPASRRPLFFRSRRPFC